MTVCLKDLWLCAWDGVRMCEDVCVRVIMEDNVGVEICESVSERVLESK